MSAAGGVLGAAAEGPLGAAIGTVVGPMVDHAMASGVTSKVVTARMLSGLAKAIRSGDPVGIQNALKQVRSWGLVTQRLANAAQPGSSWAPIPALANNPAPMQVSQR
jgi:hypothetical protein